MERNESRFDRRCHYGFTLLELSVVLLVLSLMLSSVLAIANQNRQRETLARVRQEMNTIQESLVSFQKSHNRLPCPADAQLAMTNGGFGIPAANPGICTGGSPAATFSDGANTVAGMVPVSTLGLSEDYAFDPWGGRFLYVVDSRATAILTGVPASQPDGVLTSSIPAGASGTIYPVDSSGIGSITIEDNLKGVIGIRTSKALVAVISHGPNGHGAFQLASGKRKSSGSTNSSELQNCHCTSATPTAATTFDATFFMDYAASASGPDILGTFDDIVRYQTRADLLSSDERLTEKP